jgi:DNA-directed RNA polymerase subunit N (RpoN/RPB10)
VTSQNDPSDLSSDISYRRMVCSRGLLPSDGVLSWFATVAWCALVVCYRRMVCSRGLLPSDGVLSWFATFGCCARLRKDFVNKLSRFVTQSWLYNRRVHAIGHPSDLSSDISYRRMVCSRGLLPSDGVLSWFATFGCCARLRKDFVNKLLRFVTKSWLYNRRVHAIGHPSDLSSDISYRRMVCSRRLLPSDGVLSWFATFGCCARLRKDFVNKLLRFVTKSWLYNRRVHAIGQGFCQ